MRFLGRWLSHSLSLGLALLFGLAAMQAPAFIADYAGSLLQVSADARRDVDQRETAARQYYGLAAGDDAATIAALKPHEPANAEGLALTIDRIAALQQARARILESNPLVRPLTAAWDALDDPQGYKAVIWHTALETYSARLDLTPAAIVYGVAGLMLGSLIAHLILAPVGVIASRRSRLEARLG